MIEDLLNLLAIKNHSSPEKILSDMEAALDTAWNHRSEESEALRDFFDGQKPTVEEFIEYLAGTAQKVRGVNPFSGNEFRFG